MDRTLLRHRSAEFVELKLEERAQRHERQGSSRYLLEPNVKEGKGGLRDLQTLFWIGKYLNHAATAEDLMQLGLFTRVRSTTRVTCTCCPDARPSS